MGHPARKVSASSVYRIRPEAEEWTAENRPARMLAVAPLQYDIIDIDTYGEPWRHYFAAAESMRAPATVFLTSGNGAGMLSNTSTIKGCSKHTSKRPASFGAQSDKRMHTYFVAYSEEIWYNHNRYNRRINWRFGGILWHEANTSKTRSTPCH